MKHTQRLELTDDIKTAIIKLCDGNPGALSVLIESVKQCEAIDPDNFIGPYGVMFGLDSVGIYGSAIWVLYKDVCGEDMVKLVGVLRGNQLGFVSSDELLAVSNTRGGKATIDVDNILKQVRERLPKFKR
jgi:hypothetical protein